MLVGTRVRQRSTSQEGGKIHLTRMDGFSERKRKRKRKRKRSPAPKRKPIPNQQHLHPTLYPSLVLFVPCTHSLSVGSLSGRQRRNEEDIWLTDSAVPITHAPRVPRVSLSLCLSVWSCFYRCLHLLERVDLRFLISEHPSQGKKRKGEFCASLKYKQEEKREKREETAGKPS